MKRKRVGILGSTGSIGRSALAFIAQHMDMFNVTVMTAGRNITLLEKQIKLFSPEVVAVADISAAAELRKRIGKKRSSALTILSGRDGIICAAADARADFVLSAIVGAAGLLPTLAAIRAGKTIGLANKEALVMAGRIVMQEAKKHGAKILPVDSEHSAVFQCIEGHRRADVRRVILTASGGPFAGRRKGELHGITPEDALRHPSWKMGKKITIDSATLMNKGFEVIEAHHLFGLPSQGIDVVVHPQSIVHSIVEFNDRSCIAQMSMPDMKGPISYALTYPVRFGDVVSGLSLHEIGALTFRKPQHRCFPCLSYAYRALESGGTMPSVLNAANEIAVEAFLNREIAFTEIPTVIRKTMVRHTVNKDKDLQVILEADRWAREHAKGVVHSLMNSKHMKKRETKE